MWRTAVVGICACAAALLLAGCARDGAKDSSTTRREPLPQVEVSSVVELAGRSSSGHVVFARLEAGGQTIWVKRLVRGKRLQVAGAGRAHGGSASILVLAEPCDGDDCPRTPTAKAQVLGAADVERGEAVHVKVADMCTTGSGRLDCSRSSVTARPVYVRSNS